MEHDTLADLFYPVHDIAIDWNQLQPDLSLPFFDWSHDGSPQGNNSAAEPFLAAANQADTSSSPFDDRNIMAGIGGVPESAGVLYDLCNRHNAIDKTYSINPPLLTADDINQLPRGQSPLWLADLTDLTDLDHLFCPADNTVPTVVQHLVPLSEVSNGPALLDMAHSSDSSLSNSSAIGTSSSTTAANSPTRYSHSMDQLQSITSTVSADSMMNGSSGQWPYKNSAGPSPARMSDRDSASPTNRAFNVNSPNVVTASRQLPRRIVAKRPRSPAQEDVPGPQKRSRNDQGVSVVSLNSTARSLSKLRIVREPSSTSSMTEASGYATFQVVLKDQDSQQPRNRNFGAKLTRAKFSQGRKGPV